MDRLENTVNGLAVKMENGFAHVFARLDVHTVALENIDKRLDDLELQNLPRRVRRLERKVFAKAA